MKDFIQKYKEKNFVYNLSIIVVSFLLAILINFSIGDSQIGKSIKSSVLESTQTQEVNNGELYLSLIENGDSIGIKSGKDMSQVSKLSFSLSYSADGVKVNSFKAEDSSTIIQNLANKDGFQTVFFIFPSPKDLKKDETIGTIQITKLSQKVEYINLFSVNSEDISKNLQELSSSGIDF